MAYADITHVRNDADDEEFGPEAQVSRIVRTASNIVEGMVREPDESDPDYYAFRGRARDATLAVFWWLYDTGGYIALKRSPTDSSVGYAANPKVVELVKLSMGPYFRSPGGGVVMGGIRRKGARLGSVNTYAPPDPYDKKGRM